MVYEGTFENNTSVYVPSCASVYYNTGYWQNVRTIPININTRVAYNSGGSVYNTCGTNVVEAEPDRGYKFVQWSDGNTDNPREFELTTSDLTFTAEFELASWIVSVSCNTAHGSVMGGGYYANRASCTMRAQPNNGYRFVRWSDGNVDNPRTITVTRDVEYTAEFEKTAYIIHVNQDCNIFVE